MLSIEELFSARNREKSLPQRSHGQKDFIPDGSEIQCEKLQLCRTEHWQLLREERVERLGNLVKGNWKPKENLVELTSPAGKFWQTMGFTDQGRQCLLPEEGLYLLECGAVQLFHSGLPLSVQEAYDMLLGDQKFSILHYQVYSHLKRLGYIVTRFDPSSILSSYQRQLNVESFTKPPRKRKRSASPRLKSKIKLDTVRDMEKDNDNVMFIGIGSLASIKTDTFSSNPVARTKDIQSNSQLVSTDHQNISVNQEAGVQLQTQDCILNCSKSGNSAVEGPVKTVRTHRWDFSKICLPNCGHQLPYTLLPLPEPTFLPENITAREVDISHWMLKLNMRPEKLSQREREQLNWERKYKSSINNDPKVKKCSNWREYKELLLQRSHSSSKSSPHLWASAVKPLLRPEIINTTASVLDQITVMSPSLLLDDCESWPQSHKKNLPQIIFNVYQADGASDFKKSKPGKPYTRMCVRSFDDQVPSLHTVKMLVYQSGDVPLIFALVDNGEVAFYSFKDFQLPVDIYP